MMAPAKHGPENHHPASKIVKKSTLEMFVGKQLL